MVSGLAKFGWPIHFCVFVYCCCVVVLLLCDVVLVFTVVCVVVVRVGGVVVGLDLPAPDSPAPDSPKCRFFFPAGVSDDSPRTPNVHILGPGLQNHHQDSTRRPPREGRKKEKCGGRGNKKREILGLPP